MKNKRFLSMLLCLCMAFSLFVGLGSTEAHADGFVYGGYAYAYTVRTNGTSAASVCQALGMPYDYVKDAIYILNGWDYTKNVNSLPAGTVLYLPNGTVAADMIKSGTVKMVQNVDTNSSSSTPSVNGNLKPGDYIAYYLVPHTVLNNETLYSICNDLGVSYNTYANLICTMSGITNTRNVKAGTIVYIPTLTAPKSGSYYCVIAHKVLKNETMLSICNGYNVNYYNFYNVLAGLNSNVNLNYIKQNQTVYLPVPSGSVVPTPTPPVSPSTSPSPTPVTGYAISFNDQGKGTSYCVVGENTDALRAEAGEKVTIYCEPSRGYAVHAITVTRLDCDAYVPVVDNAFTMPASDVKITTLYEKGDYAIKCLTPTYGTFDVYVGGAVCDAADYGDQVIVTVQPDSGYVVESVVYQKSDGKIAAVNVRDDNNDGIYEFLMPNYNVNLSATFKKAEQKNISYKVSYEGVQTLKGSTVAYFEYEGARLTKGTAPVGGIIYLEVSPEAAKGVDDIVINNDPKIKVSDLGNNVYSFKMPNADTVVEIKLTDGYGTRKSHLLTEIDHSSTSFVTLSAIDAETGNVSTWAQAAKAGDKVVIVEYPLAGWRYESAEAFCSDGSTKVKLLNDGKNDYFIMPDYDVTVTCNFVQDGAEKYGIIKYTSATLQSNSWQFRCYDSKGVERNCFKPGEKVKIEAVPDAGYAINELKAHYQGWVWWWGYYDWTETLKPDKNGLYDFNMPASNVTLTLTFKKSNQFAPTTIDLMRLKDDKAHGSAYLQANGHSLEYVENALGVSSTVYKEFVVDDVGVGTKINVVTLPDAHYMVDYVKVRSAGWGGLTATRTIKPDDNGEYFYTVSKNDVKTGVTFEVKFKEYDRSDMPKYTVQYAFSELGRYDIYVNQESAAEFDEHVSGEPCQAVEGDYVTLVAIPNAGYTFDSVIIDGKEYHEAVPGISGNFTYTFQMPARNVSTEFTFVKVNYNLANRGIGTLSEDKKTFTPAATSNTAFTFKVAAVQNATTANYKDVVQVIPSTVGGYEIDEVYYKFHDDTTWTEANDNFKKDGTFTFTMSKPMDVDVCAVAKVKTFSVKSGVSSAPVIDGGIQFSVDNGANWYKELPTTDNAVTVKAGDTVKYSIPLADDYTSYDKLSVLVNGVETEVNLSTATIITTEDGKHYYEGTFEMPAQDTVLSVVPTASLKKSVKPATVKDADLFQGLTMEGKKYPYGSMVTESLTLPADAVVGKICYQPITGEDPEPDPDVLYDISEEEGESSKVTGASYDPVTKTIKFTMPDSDVELSIVLNYPVSFSFDKSLGTLQVAGKYVEPSDILRANVKSDVGSLVATPKDATKYRAVIKVTAADGSDVALDNDNKFKMPEQPVTVKVDFVKLERKLIQVNIADDEKHATWSATVNGKSVGINSKLTDHFFANEGDVIVFKVVADAGWQLRDPLAVYVDATTHPNAVAIFGISYAPKNVGTKCLSTNPMTHTFTFYVQDSDVTICNINTESVSALYKPTFAGSNGGTVKFYYDEECFYELPKEGVPVGSTVYAKINMKNTYQYVEAQEPLFFTDATNIKYPLSDIGGQVIPGKYDTVYKFTMPAKDISVILNVELKVNSINVVSTPNGSIKFVDENKAAIDTNKVKAETRVYPVVNSVDKGYVLKYCEVKWEDADGNHDLYVGPNCDNEYFTMPAVSVTVTPRFEEPLQVLEIKPGTDYDISITVDGDAVPLPPSGKIDIKYDKEVVLTLTSKNGKEFSSINANGKPLNQLAAKKYTSNLPTSETYEYTFNMPNKNLTITVSTDELELPLSITGLSDGADYTVKAWVDNTPEELSSGKIENLKKGQEIKIEFEIKNKRPNKVFKSIKTADGYLAVLGTYIADNQRYVYTFDMPNEDVDVTVEVVDTYTITISSLTPSDFTVSGAAGKFKEGDTVTLTFTANLGKTFDSIKSAGKFLPVEDGLNATADDSQVSDGILKYTFIMPANDVAIDVVTEAN